MTCLGSFSAPYVFGGGFRVMTTQIFASKQNGEIGVALVETVVLALVAVIGLALLRRTEGDALLVGLGKGTAPRRRALASPLMRASATLLGWGFAILLLLPHFTLILVSLVPYATWTTQALPPVLGLVNYGRLLAEPERLEPLLNSLWMAATSTAAAVALALAAGWLVVRRRVVWRAPIDWLLSVPWALPGTVFAIALATAFSVHAPLAFRWVLVGTVFILPLAYLVAISRHRPGDPGRLSPADPALGGRGESRRRAGARCGDAAAAGPPWQRGQPASSDCGRLRDLDRASPIATAQSPSRSTRLAGQRDGVAAAFGVVLMVTSSLVLGLGARR
jgi:ABC-type sulfate transport system permease component